jgi:hypothetical protein
LGVRIPPGVLSASNRFHDTANAIQFVEALYSAGAAKIIVNQENIVDEGGGDLYADALVVQLPQDPAARRRVVAIGKRESDREAGAVSSDAEWDKSLSCAQLPDFAGGFENSPL